MSPSARAEGPSRPSSSMAWMAATGRPFRVTTTTSRLAAFSVREKLLRASNTVIVFISSPPGKTEPCRVCGARRRRSRHPRRCHRKHGTARRKPVRRVLLPAKPLDPACIRSIRFVSQVHVERVQDGDGVNAAKAAKLSEGGRLDHDLEHGRILPCDLPRNWRDGGGGPCSSAPRATTGI